MLNKGMLRESVDVFYRSMQGKTLNNAFHPTASLHSAEAERGR